MYSYWVSQQLGEAHRHDLLVAGRRDAEVRAARRQRRRNQAQARFARAPQAPHAGGPALATPAIVGERPVRSAVGWWMVESGLRLIADSTRETASAGHRSS